MKKLFLSCCFLIGTLLPVSAYLYNPPSAASLGAITNNSTGVTLGLTSNSTGPWATNFNPAATNTGVTILTNNGSGTLASLTASNVVVQGSQTNSNNITLLGSNNIATNQIGVNPNLPDLVNAWQVMWTENRGYRNLTAPANWSSSSGSSGTASSTGLIANVGSATNTGAYGIKYWVDKPILNTGNQGYGNANWSLPFILTFDFFGNSITAATNTAFRFTFGKNISAAPATGDLTVKGVGFKLTLGSNNVGLLYNQVYGTNLVTSTNYVAVVDLSNSQLLHRVSMFSDGAGKVKFYLDGNYLETLTNGPTGLGGVNNLGIEMEILNSGDGVNAGTIWSPFCQITFKL